MCLPFGLRQQSLASDGRRQVPRPTWRCGARTATSRVRILVKQWMIISRQESGTENMNVSFVHTAVDTEQT
jgi:hypothetical protein